MPVAVPVPRRLGTSAERPSRTCFRMCGGNPTMLQIRLIGSPKPPGWHHPEGVFDPAIPEDRCDRMLAWGGVTPAFLRYRGPRAWYLFEPLTHHCVRPRWRRRT